ncbi:reverse transcriptase domain-containing protein [Tanacetum coccineum]
MSVRLADRSFQYPVGIAENMLVEVGKSTFLADFVILEMKEDSKVPLILGQPFLNTADVHSYSNDDSCFSIDVIDEILEEDFDALLNEGSKILHSIKGTLLEKEIFAEFDEFMAMNSNENSDSESEPKSYRSRKSPSIQIIKLEHLSKNLLRISNLNLFLIIWNMYSWKNLLFFPLSYHLSFPKKRKTNLYPSLKSTSKILLGKQQIFLVSAHHSVNTRYNYWMKRNQLSKKQRMLNPNIQEVVKKEIVKILDTGIIYPIADSPWNPLKYSWTIFLSSEILLTHCKDAHLVLNWEKCHFMVKEGIVLGHKVSSAGLEVDKAKIDVISKLPPPTNIKGIRSFLGHSDFYRRFIKDFSKSTRSLTKLLEKYIPFEFDDECQKHLNY